MLFRGQKKDLVIIDASNSEYLQYIGGVNFFLHKRDRLVAHYISRFFSDNNIDARVGNEILFGVRTYNMVHSKNNVIDVLLFGDVDSQRSMFTILDEGIQNELNLSQHPNLSNILLSYELRRWDGIGEKRKDQGVVKGYSILPKPLWGFIPSEKATYNLNFMQPK